MNEVARPGLTLFAGRFGSGKTEAAINYALMLAGDSKLDVRPRTSEAQRQSSNIKRQTSSRIILIDLDIVTPYFRPREMAAALESRGVKVIAPSVMTKL